MSIKKCSSCIVYILLLLLSSTSNIGIGTYCVYFHWYLKKDDTHTILNTLTKTTNY